MEVGVRFMLRPIYPQEGTPISILWEAGLDVSGKEKTFAPAGRGILNILTLSNPIILPTAYFPALICFGR
jgi:hypothetical protein